MKKYLVLIMGPSGSGKTAIGDGLKVRGIPETISHTTRQKRVGEVDGLSYYFVSHEEFTSLDKIEETCYAGNYYALSTKELENRWKDNDIIYCIVEKNGLQQIINKLGKDIVKVVYVKTPLDIMQQRMRDRGDSEEHIEKRLKNCIDTKELENDYLADYIIENTSTLDIAIEKVYNYIQQL